MTHSIGNNIFTPSSDHRVLDIRILLLKIKGKQEKDKFDREQKAHIANKKLDHKHKIKLVKTIGNYVIVGILGAGALLSLCGGAPVIPVMATMGATGLAMKLGSLQIVCVVKTEVAEEMATDEGKSTLRNDCVEFLRKHGINLPSNLKLDVDQNLWTSTWSPPRIALFVTKEKISCFTLQI